MDAEDGRQVIFGYPTNRDVIAAITALTAEVKAMSASNTQATADMTAAITGLTNEAMNRSIAKPSKLAPAGAAKKRER